MGICVGTVVGVDVGVDVGKVVGAAVGAFVGAFVGAAVGAAVATQLVSLPSSLTKPSKQVHMKPPYEPVSSQCVLVVSQPCEPLLHG